MRVRLGSGWGVALLVASALLSACGGGGGGGGAASAPFAVKLDAPGATVSQGATGQVHLALDRTAGFTGDVAVSLENPPDGVTADDLLLPEWARDAILDLRLSPDIGPGTVLDMSLAATSGDVTTHIPLKVTVGAPQPTSEALIQADLEAGTIDYKTSMLYRAYALFGDARLPAQYKGAVDPDNDGFFLEASEPDQPDAVKAELAPFLARPTDAASAFQAKPRGAAKRGAPEPSGCVPAPGQTELNGWKSVRGTHPIRVWIGCGGETDPDCPECAASIVQAHNSYLYAALGVADDLWPQEVGLMRTPVPDQEGGDDLFDVYLMTGCYDAPRQGGNLCTEDANHNTVRTALGMTPKAAPFVNDTCSAFSFVDVYQLDVAGGFKAVMAHELFHAIQFAYNCPIAFTHGANGGSTEFWFTEASATWAAWNFAREYAATQVHPRFVNEFQKATASLHKSESPLSRLIYADYIWPFFVQQKDGDPSSMPAAWTALIGVSGFDNANQKLNDVYDFETNFRAFGVENLNSNIVAKRYKQLDGNFPDGGPAFVAKATLSLAVTQEPEVRIAPLRAAYYEYKVTGDKLKKVVIHFDKIDPKDGLDIDARVLIKGQDWKTESYDGKDKVEFCLDKPDQALQQIDLVLSNHNLPLDQFVSGTLKVESSEAPCGGTWTGSSTLVLGYTINADVTWVLDEDHSTPTVSVYKPESGQVGFTTPGCVVTPSGQFIQPDEGTLSIDYTTDPATYRVQGGTVWQGTYKCGDGAPFDAGAGGLWVADYGALDLVASGQVSADGATIQGSSDAGGASVVWKYTRE